MYLSVRKVKPLSNYKCMMKVTKLLTLTLFLLLVITGCESTADTSFTVAITNSDPLVNGKDAVTVIRFANINAPYITLRGVFSSNIITKKVQVPNSYFINGKAEIVIT